MKFEVELKHGHKKTGSDDPRDDFSSSKPRPTPNDPTPRNRRKKVYYVDVIKIQWDPFNQQWVEYFSVTSSDDDNGEKEQGIYEVRSDNFPKDYDLPNEFAGDSDSVKPEAASSADTGPIDSGSSRGFFLWEPDDASFASVVREAESEIENSRAVTASGYGYALDSPLIEGTSNAYSFQGTSYQMFTPGGKPVCAIYPGTEVTGAQLNAIQGTNDYIPDATYVVNSVRADSWTNGQGTKLGHDTLPDMSFVSRNGQKGVKGEYTPGHTNVSIDATLKKEHKSSRLAANSFSSREADQMARDSGIASKGEYSTFAYGSDLQSKIDEVKSMSPYWSPPSISSPSSPTTGTSGAGGSDFGINLFPTIDLGL